MKSSPDLADDCLEVVALSSNVGHQGYDIGYGAG